MDIDQVREICDSHDWGRATCEVALWGQAEKSQETIKNLAFAQVQHLYQLARAGRNASVLGLTSANDPQEAKDKAKAQRDEHSGKVAILAQSILDSYLIPVGEETVKLGDATAEQLLDHAEWHLSRAATMTKKAEWFKAIAGGVTTGKTVRECFDAAAVDHLWEQQS